MYNAWEPCQYPPDSKGKAQVPPLAQCCVFGASALIKCPLLLLVVASFPGLQSPNAVEGLVKLPCRMTSGRRWEAWLMCRAYIY